MTKDKPIITDHEPGDYLNQAQWLNREGKTLVAASWVTAGALIDIAESLRRIARNHRNNHIVAESLAKLIRRKQIGSVDEVLDWLENG
ncbi:MAG: hypothetical protein Q7O66_19850 [Dehalococcoidia bacterium]|nr:hypothetical protein [Dehalococcoidia bacterium]